MKPWMIPAYYAAVLAVIVGIAATSSRRRSRREHQRLALEEAQRLHDYLHARAEVAYLELKFAAGCAEEPSYEPGETS